MSYHAILARYFREHPGIWVDGLTLGQLAGAYAWRSRLTNVRQIHGMCIENRQRKVGRRTVSEYRYQPASEPRQANLLERAS